MPVMLSQFPMLGDNFPMLPIVKTAEMDLSRKLSRFADHDRVTVGLVTPIVT